MGHLPEKYYPTSADVQIAAYAGYPDVQADIGRMASAAERVQRTVSTPGRTEGLGILTIPATEVAA